MEHFLGFIALSFFAAITLHITYQYPKLRVLIFATFVIRACTALFHFYFFPLPDSKADAVTFENLAWQWAQSGFIDIWTTHLQFDSYMISRVIGTLYALTDRSLLMAQALSVGLGIGSVYMVYRLADMLWGPSTAQKAAWVAALFPTLVLYSALTMREAYIWFFFLLGLLGVAHWASGRTIKGSFFAVLGFVLATLFHGAMFIALAAFLAILGWSSLKSLTKRLSAGFVRPVAAAGLLVSILAVGSYLAGTYSVPKFGSIDQLLNAERVLSRIEDVSHDSASYPQWMVPESLFEILYLTPARTAYFLFAPFPWDVTSPRHLVGMADGMLYLGLFALMWRNRKGLWANPRARPVLLVLLPVLLIFAVAIGNFGTSIRHRSKIAGVLIVLVAPSVPRFVLSKKKLQLDSYRHKETVSVV